MWSQWLPEKTTVLKTVTPREKGDPFLESVAAGRAPVLKTVTPRERRDPIMDQWLLEKLLFWTQ